MADFFAGWDDVANRPGDVAARSQLVERATTLAAGFGQLDAALTGLRTSAIAELATTVDAVNSTATRIAELNHSIESTVKAGLSPNELLDQRDLLISGLAEQVGVTVRAGESPMLDVFVGGSALVRGTMAEALAVTMDSNTATDTAQTVRVVWQKDGYPASVNGAGGALLGAINDILPRYRAGLEAVAAEIAGAVKILHAGGYAPDGSTGRDFFVFGPAGLSVNPDIAADPMLVAAAAQAVWEAALPDGTPFDGSLAQQLAGLSGSDETYQKLVVGLGVESQAVNRRVDVQAAITRHIGEARESVAGVNLDEEMANMVSFGHAYDAAARFLTAIDQMLDTLINGTSLVGR